MLNRIALLSAAFSLFPKKMINKWGLQHSDTLKKVINIYFLSLKMKFKMLKKRS